MSYPGRELRWTAHLPSGRELPRPDDEPSARRRVLIGGAAIVGLLLLALLARTVIRSVDQRVHPPAAPVRAYYADLHAGRFDRALAPLGLPLRRDALLTPAILATVTPESYTVSAVSRVGSGDRVEIRTRKDGVEAIQYVLLQRSGNKHLPLSDWVLSGINHATVTVQASDLRMINVNGVHLPLDQTGRLVSLALPGRYAVTGYDPDGWLTSDQPVATIGSDATSADQATLDATIELETQASAKFVGEVDRQVAALVTRCARRRAPASAGCPFGEPPRGISAPRWAVVSLPHATLTEQGGVWRFESLGVGIVHLTGTTSSHGVTRHIALNRNFSVGGKATIHGNRITVSVDPSAQP